jgi:hypothetical protein
MTTYIKMTQQIYKSFAVLKDFAVQEHLYKSTSTRALQFYKSFAVLQELCSTRAHVQEHMYKSVAVL